MKKQIFKLNIFFLICSIIFLSISCNSCNNKTAKRSDYFLEVDFLINDEDTEKFEIEFTEEDLKRNPNDPKKVKEVKIGQKIKFQDITKNVPEGIIRSWVLDEQEDWNGEKNSSISNDINFEYIFQEIRYHKVSLQIGDGANIFYATKIISVIDRDEQFAGNSKYKDDLFNTSAQFESSSMSSMNIDLMLNNIFQITQNSKEQEQKFQNYLDSIRYFLDDNSMVICNGVKTDLIDLISLAIITKEKVKLEEKVVFKNKKISYLSVSKE